MKSDNGWFVYGQIETRTTDADGREWKGSKQMPAFSIPAVKDRDAAVTWVADLFDTLGVQATVHFSIWSERGGYVSATRDSNGCICNVVIR